MSTTIEGDLIVNGSISAQSISSTANIMRSSLEEDALKTCTINLADIRVHDAVHTVLPGTPATDDFGLVGTDYTSTPILRTIDEDNNGAPHAVYGRFFFPLPVEYVSGGDIRIQIYAGYNTAAPDGSGDLDVECKVWDVASGALGSDICTTSAQDISSTTISAKTFVVTGTNRVAGDTLDIRFSITTEDNTGATVNIGEITKIMVLLDVKG